MTQTKAQKSGSWTPQIQKKAPSLAPPPIVVQRDAIAAPTSEAPLSEYTPLEPNALQNHPLMGNISDLPPIQTKLTIGAPGDRYEQEADTIARKVVSQINSPTAQAKPATKVLQRQPVGRDITVSPFAGMMQAKEAIGGGPASQDLESSINRAKGGGQALDAGLQQSMGQAMGADFSGVKVHTDANSNQLNQSIQAKAFTTGQDIFFKQGQYDPGSKDGQELIAHELTHVVQQNGNKISSNPHVQSKLETSNNISSSNHTFIQAQRERSNAVSRINEGIILDRLNKEKFKEYTYEGVFAGRGSTLKEIETLLDELDSLRPLTPEKINDAIDIANSIEELMRFWMEDHAEDSSRENRMEGMKQCHNYVKYNIIPVLQKKSREFTLNGQTVTSTSRTAPDGVTELREKHQGSAKSMFSKLAWMLDSSVPLPGDKSKIEIEFKIPVDPSGVGFIGGRFTCEAERDTSSVKARGEMAITGGAKVSIAEIKGELGGYIEAQAKDSDRVMKLISYSMYRRFEESKWLPRKISNFAWGGSSGSVGFKRAERWAGALEKEVFGGLAGEESENTYVETGSLASVGAEFNVGIGKAKGQIKGTTGRRYDKESVETLKLGGLGSARKTASLGESQEVIARSSHALEISAGIEAGPIKGEGKLTWKWMQGIDSVSKKSTPSQLKTWEIEVSGAISLPINELVGSGIGPYMAQWAASIIELVRRGQQQASNQAQDVGTGISLAENATIGITQLARVPQEQFTPKFEVSESSGFSGSMDLKLTFKLEKGGKGTFSLDYVKAVGLDLSVFKGSIEKSKRILQLEYEGGTWTVS
jgi:hypothetical protein